MSEAYDQPSTRPRMHYTRARGERMKPSLDEFDEAYSVIMAFIDTEPGSRPLFHALLSFKLRLMNDQEE